MTRDVILVVDDEPHVLAAVTERLRHAGFRVLAAGDGEEALRLVKAHRPDLVILDFFLPKYDGYQVCQAIKQDPALRMIPVVMLTGRSCRTYEGISFEAGADAYLRKPFDSMVILDTIEELIHRAHAYAQAHHPTP